MKPPVVMWDLDGVLANFTWGYHTLANRMHGWVADPDSPPPAWDWLEDTIGSDKVNAIWNRIKQSETFWEELPPLAKWEEWDALFALPAYQYFATSRVGKHPLRQTINWLRQRIEDHGPLDDFELSVAVSNRKADMANGLNANYTIDDKIGNVLAVYYNSPPERRVYVLDQPYNQLDTRLAGRRVRRVQSVGEFIEDVKNRK